MSLKPQTASNADVARKKSLERQEPRKKPREEPGSDGWPVLFWLCRVEIITVHGQDVQTFIDDQQGQIIIIPVVVEGATDHLWSKCQLAFHSRSFRVRDSRCVRESQKQQARDKVARPVNRSGDSKESSGQVVLRHGDMAQVLQEKRKREKERERIRGSILKFTQDT
jgi:hypothetical protein